MQVESPSPPPGAAPLDRDALHALLADPACAESVGPGTDRPALVAWRYAVDARTADRLATLPCPVIGIGADGPAAPFDLLLDDCTRLAPLLARIAATPIAATVLVQHLRASAGLPLAAALTAESMAYATLQAGPELRRWLDARGPVAAAVPDPQPPVRIVDKGGVLTLTLDRAGDRNPIGIEMRDALCAAFDLAAATGPGLDRVVLEGAGRFFSSGGDLREFGLARDPATAHCVRSARLPAARLLPIADRLEVRVGGGAIGAGIEIAAFAARVVARPRAWFQLPEIGFGLIPGAGGTVSIARRIGRHRAAELMLSGRRIRADEALAWRLIDAIEG